MPDPKKQLSISLTEPVAFLRSSDPSGRLRPDPNDSPSLVRGLVTLNVVKPIRISNIQVELTGMMLVSWVEVIGSRRMEMIEEQKVYSSTIKVFSAGQAPHERRTASVGPGLSLTYPNEQDDHAERNISRPLVPPRGRSDHRNSVDLGRPLSIDVTLELPSADTSRDNASSAPGGFELRSDDDLGPTPPYTPARSSIVLHSRPSAPVESPAQTLEDLRQALRDNLDNQGNWHRHASAPPSARSHATFFAPPPMGHSSTSSISSVQREYEGASPHLRSAPLSRHPSLEEPPQFSLSSPRAISSRTHSPDNTRGSLPGTRESSHEPSHTRAGRAHSRFSLGSVLDAVKEVASRTRSRSRGFADAEESERGRTRVRPPAGEEAGNIIPETSESIADSGNNIHQNGHENSQQPLGLGRVLGLDRDHERNKEGEDKSKEEAEGWREFKPGTYTYPISFLLPPNLPPSFSLPHGSLNYTLKAVAHRPGAFTSKLSCQIPLVLIAAPSIGAGEGGGAGDPGPVTVEKQWEGKLAYVFGLSGRLFVLGSQRRLEAATNERFHANIESQVEARAEAAYGTAVLDITMMPLEKIKIWRLTVSIDEKVSGVDQKGRIVREDEKRRVTLLEVHDSCPAELSPVEEEESKHKNKQKKEPAQIPIPLLPTPISPHRSPLLRYLSASADPSTLAGPGPYMISTTIALPGCDDAANGDQLHFTIKQRNSGVRVEHTLRFTMRVELVGDNASNESEEASKRKIFDVAVQTPVTILSCRCVPEFQVLPRYSQIAEDSTRDLSACPCELSNSGPPLDSYERDPSFEHTGSSASTSSLESENAAASHDRIRDVVGQTRSSRSTSRAPSQSQPRTPSRSGRNDHGRPPSVMHTPHNHHVRSHSHSHSHSHSIASPSYAHGHSLTPVSTPSRPPSPLARYERLVSGLESEAGEAPPSYESVAANS